MKQNGNSFKDIIYNTEKRYKSYMGYLEGDEDITAKNKYMFLEFIRFCLAQGLTKQRLMIYLRWLRVLGQQTMKSFDKTMKRRDLEAVLAAIMQRNYADHSVQTVKVTVKKYFRWVYGLTSHDSLPEVVKWISGTKPPSMINKEDLLVPEDVQRLIEATPNIEYKAMIATQFWGALRPGELLSMTIGSVKFGSCEVMITVSGKMEKMHGPRQIPLYEPYDYLRTWLQSHPFKRSQHHPLWISNKPSGYLDASGKKHLTDIGEPLSLVCYSRLLRRLRKIAKIEKPVFPYLLRHSRARMLYLELGEALAKKYMGHAPDSKMARFYSHLVDDDLITKMRAYHGIVSQQEEGKTTSCPRCFHPNAFDSQLCSACNFALRVESGIHQIVKTEEGIEQLETMKRFLDFLETNPIFKRLLADPHLLEQFVKHESIKKAGGLLNIQKAA